MKQLTDERLKELVVKAARPHPHFTEGDAEMTAEDLLLFRRFIELVLQDFVSFVSKELGE